MEELNQIIEKIFKMKPQDIRDEMTPEDIPNWDSINYLMFIAEVEKKFQITFSMDEVLNTKNFGDIKAAMRNKGIKL